MRRGYGKQHAGSGVEKNRFTGPLYMVAKTGLPQLARKLSQVPGS